MKNYAETSFVKNSFFNVVYKILHMLFPLVSTAYVSHILLAEGVGKVSYAQNIAQYFVILAPLGIVNYGTREIAKVRAKPECTNQLFSELFIINARSTLFCSLCYYALVLLMPAFAGERMLYCVTGLPILLNVFQVEWFYQGHEEYVYIALRSMGMKVLSFLLIICFVRDSQDYPIYALIYSIGIAGNYIFNIVNLHRRKVQLIFADLQLSRHMKAIIILVCSNLAIELYTLLDTTMLGMLCSEREVGYYANSVRVVRMVVSLIGAMGSVLLPRLSYYHAHDMQDECNRLIRKVTMVILYFCIPCGIGIFVLAEKLVPFLFGVSFLPAVDTVRIGTGIIFVLAFSNLFGTQVLLTYGQEKKLLLCTLLGACSNVIANTVLIPCYQQNGAMAASVISETLVTLSTILFARKYIALHIPLAFCMKSVAAGVVMGGVVWLSAGLGLPPGVSLAVSIFAGAASYFIASLLLKNEIVEEMWGMLRRKATYWRKE